MSDSTEDILLSVADRLFLALPPKLLNEVMPILRTGANDDLLEVETLMSDGRRAPLKELSIDPSSAGQPGPPQYRFVHPADVRVPQIERSFGYYPIHWFGLQIPCPPLWNSADSAQKPDQKFLKELAEVMGQSPKKVESTLLEIESQLAKIHTAASAYCGWLVLNSRFRQEHDALLNRWVSEIQLCGMPTIHAFEPIELPEVYGERRQAAEPPEMREAFRRFFLRWRLDGLPAPYLPIPLQTQGPLLSAKLKNLAPEIGTLFYFSDVLPLPSEGDLRRWIEDALRTAAPEHLAEWVRIVSASNTAKNRLDSFARRFKLQHFWRVLYLRHASALVGKKMELEIAFSRYFGVSESSIHADLLEIAKSLGPDWHQDLDMMRQFTWDWCAPRNWFQVI